MFIDVTTLPDLLHTGDDNVLAIQIINRTRSDLAMSATELGLVAVVSEPHPTTGLWAALAAGVIWRRMQRKRLAGLH